MRQRADRNEIHASPGDCANGVQIHAATGFGSRAARHKPDRLPQLADRHIVEQNDVRASGHRRGDLRERVSLNLHFEPREFLTGTAHRSGNGVRFGVTKRREMVVLDEHQIVETEPMIAPAATSYRVFLEAPPAGRGLARIEDLNVQTFDAVHVLRGERCDARKPLDKIQRHAFGTEDRPRRPRDSQDTAPRLYPLPVFCERLHANKRRKLAKRNHGKSQPGDNQRLTRAHHGHHLRAQRHGGQRGHVAAPDVLGERSLNGAANFGGPERLHTVIMATAPFAEKQKGLHYRTNACERLNMRIKLSNPLTHVSMPSAFTLVLLLASQAQAAETNAPHHLQYEPDIRAFEAADKTNPPPKDAVLFIGSSSIRKWTSAPTQFPEHKIINRGYGGSYLSDSVTFADRIVIPYRPTLIVLYAGDNDIAGGQKPGEVFRAFKAFVAQVRKGLPLTTIAYISIKPSPSRERFLVPDQEANQLIREFIDANPKLIYLDVFTPLLTPEGHTRSELFESDRLHLNEAGYKLWAEILRPVLDQADPPDRR